MAIKFAEVIVAAVQKEPQFEKNLILVPVPSAKKRIRMRGFDHILLICKNIQQLKKNFCLQRLLKRTHFYKSQTELTKEARVLNVKNAFEFDGNHKNINTEDQIVLFDDVATTLSTIMVCAEELKKQGFKKIGAIVIGRQAKFS